MEAFVLAKSSSKQPLSVALVDLGESLSIDLTKLGNKLNSLQNSWRFRVVNARPHLGKPDVDDIWFYIDRLLLELHNHKPAVNFDIVVGITHVRLENRDGSLGLPDKDFFSLGDTKRYALATDAMRQWNSPGKDLYQYFAFLVIGEVLQITAGTDMCHQEKAICLFDDCADRNEFGPAIERSRLCKPCLQKLDKAQVADDILKDVQRVLDWCRRSRWARSMQMSVANPLVALVFGTAVGWATSIYIPREWYKLVLAMVLLVFGLVLLGNRYYSEAMRAS